MPTPTLQTIGETGSTPKFNGREFVGAADDRAFVIGGVYTNTTNVDPATELGYGTWSAIAGAFAYGATTVYHWERTA